MSVRRKDREAFTDKCVAIQWPDGLPDWLVDLAVRLSAEFGPGAGPFLVAAGVEGAMATVGHELHDGQRRPAMATVAATVAAGAWMAVAAVGREVEKRG